MSKEKRSNYFLLGSYLVIVLVFIFTVIFLPSIYAVNQQRYASEVEHELFDLFALEREADIADALRGFRDEHAVEMAVLTQDDKVIYQSLPGIPYLELRSVLQKESIIYEVMGDVEGKDGEYKLWFAIYRPSVAETVDQIFFIQFLLVAVLTIILGILFWRMQRQLEQPLFDVKRALEKLNNFELDAINQDATDVINRKVATFATKLDRQIQSVSRNHTELEYALQLERERLQNVMDVSRGVIHDLKTPVHQIMIENELSLKGGMLSDDGTIIANYNINKLEILMQEINETIKLMDTDVATMIETKEELDVVALYDDISNGFRSTLENKKVYIDASLDDEVLMNKNKVAMHLIIHNLLSNALAYVKEETDINVEIYKEADEVKIIVENETSPENIERINNSDALFMEELSQEKTDDYIYSTGNGVYLIKELTTLQEGEYKISTDEKQQLVTIELTF